MIQSLNKNIPFEDLNLPVEKLSKSETTFPSKEIVEQSGAIFKLNESNDYAKGLVDNSTYNKETIDEKFNAIKKEVESLIGQHKLSVATEQNKKYEKWLYTLGGTFFGTIFGAIITNLPDIINFFK